VLSVAAPWLCLHREFGYNDLNQFGIIVGSRFCFLTPFYTPILSPSAPVTTTCDIVTCSKEADQNGDSGIMPE